MYDSATAIATPDDRIGRRLKALDFKDWRVRVEATGGCAHPVRMSGEWSVVDNTTAQVVSSRSGHVFVPCGNRRASVCLACSDRYSADAFHLIRAGLSGGAKNVPETVSAAPRVFLTLTAPSFGPVHNRRTSTQGKAVPCACGTYHHPDDPRLGSPLDPDCYDYQGMVLWQANSGHLWHRFRITLARRLANAAGLTVRELREHARLSYAKVAEYQRRGVVHFHAVIRVDGPTGPADQSPPWATTDLLIAAVRDAVRAVTVTVPGPSGKPVMLAWGDQVDIRPITHADATDIESASGVITERRLAAYVAKYATKNTGTSEAAERRIRSQVDIDHLRVSEHHRRIIQICWDLGARPEFAHLNLRRWAHMLGFRGHFLTKSQYYSVTFTTIRNTRREWRLHHTLTELGVTADTVTVINNWQYTGTGYTNQAEYDIATGIAERLRTQRLRKYEQGATQWAT